MHILDRFSAHVREVLSRSIRLATDLFNAEVEPTHLFFCLANQQGSVAAEILNRFALTPKIIEGALLSLTRQPTDSKTAGQIALFSPSAKLILEKALLIAEEHRHTYVGTEHLLRALLEIRDPAVVRLLERQNVKLADVDKQLSTVLSNASQFPELTEAAETAHRIEDEMMDMPVDGEHDHQHTHEQHSPPPHSRAKKMRGKKESALEFFGVHLTSPDVQKTIDPVIGRDAEIERVIQILCRRTKNNPLLLGDPGVGKTAVVEGLAKKIVEGTVPEILLNKKMYALDVSMLVAGTMYRGEFEARLHQVIEEVTSNPDIILFIDELHNIVGAGSNQGTMDAANILKPALARGQIRCIGATTPNEFKKFIESDPALERRFQPVQIKEPSIPDTISILKGLRPHYEQYHHVEIKDDAIVKAVELSERYITSKFLPDKALDLIDETASAAKLSTKGLPWQNKLWRLKQRLEQTIAAKEKAASRDQFMEAVRYKDEESRLRQELKVVEKEGAKKVQKNVASIDALAVAKQVGKLIGVPPTELMLAEYDQLATLSDRLKKRVVGQDTVVDRVAGFIRQAELGLSDPRRPLASFMFVGESGVGKTELAKTLAEALYPGRDALIKLDMSEYNEGFAVSKLLGSPAGYVGYKEANQFTDRIKMNPHCILVFDEFDKAHHDVRRLLLQMLEQGEITDSTGRMISLRHAIIIMTTSYGSEQAKRGTFGFGSGEQQAAAQAEQVAREQLKEFFTPELLNRIDAVCLFKPLLRADLARIAAIELEEFNQRLSAYHTALVPVPEAIEWLLSRAGTALPGARDVRRTLREQVEKLMVDVITKRTIKPEYRLAVKDHELVIK